MTESNKSLHHLTLFACTSFLLFYCGVSVLLAAEDSPWTPDDILLAQDAGGFEIAPDAGRVVWVKTQMDKEKGRRFSNLYLSSLVEKKEIQLTRGKFVQRSPRWSPEGKLIAFLSSRPSPDKSDDEGGNGNVTGLWLLNTEGGEPWPVVDFKRSVRDFAWKDANTIVFAAEEDPSLFEQEKKKEKDNTEIVDDAAHQPPVRIFLLDIQKKKIRRLTENEDWIRDIAVSPDGNWVVSIHQRSLTFSFDQKITPAIFLTRIDTGETIPIEPGRRMSPRGAVWAKDSGGFYFATEYSSDPFYFTAAVTRLHYYDLSSHTATQVDLDWPRGLGGYGLSVKPIDGGFLALLADGVRFRPALYRRQGSTWTREDLTGDQVRNIWDWRVAGNDKTIVYAYSTASTPEQWYHADLNGTALQEEAQFTDLNPSFKNKKKFRVDVISWKGANGDTVEGLLYYPLDYQEGKRYPLMLSIHGGPSGTDLDAWSESWAYPKILLSQRGAFVLKVNYHGSGNYGLEWVESICCGKYYDLERVDIENGVDYVIQKGLADPDRLGTMGWSNGAILTTELVTRSHRFKVASAGAGDVEWISDWANVMFGASFDNYYFGKPPYEAPELYIRKSPYFRLKDDTTPTILFTGTDDVNVPPSQSWSHYRVLQQATDTPVRLVVFPGEPHGLRRYQHQKRKVEEELAWIDRYLFEKPDRKNEALKENSPLDEALALSKAGRSGDGHFGVQRAGVLTPEIVSYRDMQVSRFEITRAQFHAFDSSYSYAAGTDNFPAGGITFEQAQDYCRWLSQKTGESYHLPGSDEASTLYSGNGASENTLDYWAGYSPNLDDRAGLQEAISKLPGPAPLLRPVGEFRGRGESDPVFDLGGNVAEWTVDKDGKPELRGGGADLPAQPKADLTAAEAYRGFRVVREE